MPSGSERETVASKPSNKLAIQPTAIYKEETRSDSKGFLLWRRLHFKLALIKRMVGAFHIQKL